MGTWLTAIFDRLFAVIRARSAVNAGGQLTQGQQQVDAVAADVAAIQGELSKQPPTAPPAPPAPPPAVATGSK